MKLTTQEKREQRTQQRIEQIRSGYTPLSKCEHRYAEHLAEIESIRADLDMPVRMACTVEPKPFLDTESLGRAHKLQALRMAQCNASRPIGKKETRPYPKHDRRKQDMTPRKVARFYWKKQLSITGDSKYAAGYNSVTSADMPRYKRPVCNASLHAYLNNKKRGFSMPTGKHGTIQQGKLKKLQYICYRYMIYDRDVCDYVWRPWEQGFQVRKTINVTSECLRIQRDHYGWFPKIIGFEFRQEER